MHASTRLWLASIVTLSFAGRFAAALAHDTPRYFPDEYIYSSLARSLSQGSLAIRGTPSAFPALLEPLLAAPFWLVTDVEGAYRLTQALHALAVSLAAIPVFWLARRLGLPSWQALCAAAFSVSLPALVYSSYLTADAVAYPLVLAATAAAVAVLDRPTRRAQLAFVTFAGLACFARVQYVALAVAFAAGAAVVGRGRPRAVVARAPIVWAAFGTGCAAALLLGPGRVLGYYHGLLDFSLDPSSLGHWLAVDAMLLAFAAAAVLVPGAAVGVWCALRRPLVPAERAFAAFALALGGALLAEAALYASNGSPRFQERYLFALLPLVPIAFGVGARRLPAGRVPAALASLALLLVAARLPLTGYTALDGKQDSPFLMALAELEERLDTGSGALAASVGAALLCLVACLAALRPRPGVAVAYAAALVAAGSLTVLATSFDLDRSGRAAATFGGANGAPTWVDDHALGEVSLLVTPGTYRPAASTHLFWNRTITHVLRMPGTDEIDTFGDRAVATDARGLLRTADGAPVTGPVLAEEYDSLAILDDAELLERAPSASLWRPQHEARLAGLVVGRLLDGWASSGTTITIWPHADAPRRGRATFTLAVPAGETTGTVAVVAAPGFTRTMRVQPGGEVALSVPFVATDRPVRITISATEGLSDGFRVLAGVMSVPRLVETNP